MIHDVIKGAISGIKTWLSDHGDDLAAAQKAAENVGKAVKWAFEEIALPVIKHVLPIIKGIVEGAFTAIGGALDVIIGLLTGGCSVGLETV